MEREDSSGSGLYRPWMGAENRGCDGIAAAAELPSVDECEPIENMDDSQLVGVSGIVSVAGDEEVPAAVDVEVKAEVEVRERSDRKRKRGRPPRGQARPSPSKKKEDEDVCFICFDGGSLVLCDRRGCPKAYHPVCIKRDEAFFRSRAKWNCGWHICNSCQKAAHYLCYTCTYSLCKACTKDADYLCVRENKGFCTTCMRTIMLIENNDQGNKEMAQVDFDDKSSWEYLFKLYWIYLKSKLSLTLDELTQAQNPSKAAGIVVRKGQSLDVHYGGSYGSSISDSPSGHLGANNSKRRRTKEQPKLPIKGVSLCTDKSISDNGNTSVGSTEWASKELLEFAAHMRNGEERRRPHKNLDEYAAINVHNINLIYLRRNLMESLMVDNGKFHDKVVGSIVRIRISSSDQKQDMHRLVQVVGTCKVAVPYKIGERTTDVMLEILNLDKKETISIDSISNLQFSEDECRRLRECIKCGLVERLTVGQVQDKAMALQEVRLNDWLETEIMRLNHLWDRASEKGHKKELRECVEKLELLKTPEEHQRKLHEIPEIHVDPKVDPNCESDEDAGVISNKKQDEYVKPRSSGFSRNGREPISPRNGDISKESGSRVWKELSTCDQTRSTPSPFHLDEGAPCTVVERMNESSWNEGKNACGSNTLEKSGNQVDSSGSVVGGWNNQAVLRSGSFSGVVSETSVASLSTGSAPSADDSETDKLWHYRDQNGKIQGPFGMVQLCQWNATGLFLPDMRIWSINDEEGNSLLLTDAVANSNRDNEFVKDNGWGSHSSNWTIPVVNNNDVQTRSSSKCWDSLKVKNSYSDQPQVQCPIPSSAFTERPHETSLHQARGYVDQRWNSALNHGNWSSHGSGISQSTGGQSHENQCNSQGSGQSSGESWRPLPVNYSSNNWDSNSGFASVAKSTDSSELNIGNDIPNLPTTMPKTSNADLEGQTTKDQQLLPSNVHVQDSSIQNTPSVLPKPAGEDDNIQAIESKQSVSSNFAVQDSGLSWSSASSLVVGCGTQLPEIADEWGGAKPSVEERDSGLVSVSSLKPPVVASDHAATPTSKCDEITPSPSHPASSWQIIVPEPIEFSTLAEESVSDLLAEVDAMESQCGLASPTSMMNCGEELFQDSKADCFTSLRELSPLDSGKSDALSSTGDIQLPPQPTMTDEPLGASQVDIFDPVKRSGGQSSASTEMEVETKPTEVPDNQSEAGSNSQLPAPSTMNQNRIDTDTAPRARAKPGDTGCGTLQGNMKLGRGGSTQGITDVGSGTGQGIARANSNMDRSASAGFIGRESHIKYGGERFMGPRDRAFQGGDSVFGRGRPSWSRQSSFGAAGGGGGSYSKLPPKGQRVCKFYINGHCKKGALCDYLHPS